MIVNKPVGKQNQGNSSTKSKDKDIDINSIDKLKKGAAVAIDPNSDAWAVIAPPPAGYYAFSVGITKDGIKGTERTENVPDSMFFKINLEMKFISNDPDIAGRIMFNNVSTYIGRGKELSTALGLMLKSNKKPKAIPSPITDVDQLIYFKKWVGAQPTVYALVDWNLWSKNEQKNLLKGMVNFPQDEEGNYQATVEHEGETCNATMKVIQFVTPDEFKKIIAEQVAKGNGVGEGDIPVVVEESEPEPAPAPAPVRTIKNTAPVKPAAAAPAPVQAKPSGKPQAKPAAPAPNLAIDLEETAELSEDDADAEIGIEDFIDSDEA